MWSGGANDKQTSKERTQETEQSRGRTEVKDGWGVLKMKKD